MLLSDAWPECRRRVTYRKRGVECEKCDNWFLEKFQNNDDQFYAKMKGAAVFCSYFHKINKLDSEPETERQLFERYVNDKKSLEKSENIQEEKLKKTVKQKICIKDNTLTIIATNFFESN